MKTMTHHHFGAGVALTLFLTQALPLHAADQFTMETARAAAEKGDLRAECFLGQRYAKGDGVPRDYVKAAEYFRQAAEQGYAPAQNNLGAYYAQGWGVKQDDAEAVKWFGRAAAQGGPMAEYSLGLCYFQGRGVSKNIQECLNWYRKAADQNQTDALAALGNLCLTGTEGVKIDYSEAFKWYQKGADRGNADCLNGLGVLYEKGYGVAQNRELAANNYREAAKKGFFRAYANLGRMCQNGSNGVNGDLVEAYKWYLLGSKVGDLVALHYLEEMDSHNVLSEAEHDEARRRASEFLTAQRAKINAQTKPGVTPN